MVQTHGTPNAMQTISRVAHSQGCSAIDFGLSTAAFADVFAWQ